DELLGPAGAPKSRQEICNSLGVRDGDGTDTNLNLHAVYPVYVKTAASTYETRSMYEHVEGAGAIEAGAKFVKNAVLGSIKLLLCAPPDPSAPTSTFASGFVWSQSPYGSYVADSSYSYNSSSSNLGGTGVDNTITQLSTGTYSVEFPGLGTETGGNVQVTAYGGSSERCKVGSWNSNGSALTAIVYCHDTSGALVDTQFTASYLRHPAGAPKGGATGGYVWANEATSDSYTPDPTYQWNASGALNTIERSGVGNYWVTFPGVALNGGNAQVTAYGWGSEYCNVGSWGSNVVNVTCFDTTGAPADAQFTLNFSDNNPNVTPSYHYAWANEPWSESYTPSTYYQRGYLSSSCSFAGTMTMRRWSTGNYTASIPALSPTGSNVKVTAYGGSSNTCKVTGWYGSGDGTDVGIACFNAAGEPVDTYFTIVYSSNQYIIC
ncbi:MAG TPA: hypothetical protein VFQ61_04075, partial [Polyangiaceae bacterium]|nr:hypothetical protein [Polyangiaceae bacterium]